jgi:hypothetical protein
MHIKQITHAMLFTALIAFVTPTYAGPNDYVRTPIVEAGEQEIDFKSGIQHQNNGSETAHSIGYGRSITNQWFTELYVKYKRPADEHVSFDAWEWENRIQLTETGKYPVDMGFLLEIERPKDRAEGYELTYGPLIQSEWGKVQGNFNLLLQKHVRASDAFDTELHYQTQLKYRHSEKLEWGVQALGNLGAWNHWNDSSQQEHQIGPALFGKIKIKQKSTIKWNTALLFGTTHATPNTTLRLQAEYEF